MAIDIDASQPLVRPSDRLALVRAVLNAHPSDEAEWIEWKQAVPLEQPAGRFAVSKHILGFANRSPNEARRFAAGAGFLLIGVEPGKLTGTQRRDPAELEDRLNPFVGRDGPLWDAHHIETGGAEVLLIEVTPPSEGDPIHTLRRDFENWHEGTVFVRHKGKTEPASSADMVMLTTRAKAQRGTGAITLDVEWGTSEPTIRPIAFSSEDVEHLVEEERKRLLASLESSESSNETGLRRSPSDYVGLSSLAGWLRDNREPEDFREEVTKYLERLRSAAVNVGLAQALRRRISRLETFLVNPTDTNFLEVRVILKCEAEVFAFDPDAFDDIKLPNPPDPWGTPRRPWSMGTSLTFPSVSGPNLRQSRMTIDHSQSAIITFDPIDLRPRAKEALPPFNLFAEADLRGQDLSISWEATSTNADGWISGTLPLRVSDDVLTLLPLLSDSTEGESSTD